MLDDEFVNVHVGINLIVDDGCNYGQFGTDIVFGIVSIIIPVDVNGSVKVKDIV